MTPRAYAAAKALAVDPGATPAERENAAARVREYEAQHGKPAPPRTVDYLLIIENGRMVYSGPTSGYRAPRPQPRPVEHDMRDLCAGCGKTWALHGMAAAVLEGLRPEARPCRSFHPKMKPARRPARPGVRVPWWTLELRNTAGRRLGLTHSFRAGLRWIREQIEQPRARGPWTLYEVPPETMEHIERNEVDWTWFPSQKDEPWRPPAEMRAAMREQKRSTP